MTEHTDFDGGNQAYSPPNPEKIQSPKPRNNHDESTGTSMLDEAIGQYTGRGWAVFPLHGIVGGRCTCGDDNCKPGGKHERRQGKHPCTKNGVKNASADPRLAEFSFKHAKPYPNVNIGIAFGAASKMIGVDVDGAEGEATLATIMNGEKLPLTYECRSGREGGRHLYFKRPRGVTIPNHDGCGVEIKSDNKYLVAPPSMHISGRRYEVVRDIEMALLPNALVRFSVDKIKLNGSVGISSPTIRGKSLRAEPLPDFGEPPPITETLAELITLSPSFDDSTWESGELAVWLHNDFMVAKVKSALAAIPAEDRDVWFKVGAALHDLDWPESRDLWDELSPPPNSTLKTRTRPGAVSNAAGALPQTRSSTWPRNMRGSRR